MSETKLLRASEAAAELGISVYTLRRLDHADDLHARDQPGGAGGADERDDGDGLRGASSSSRTIRRMDVSFNIEGEIYTLAESQATTLAENLRRTAAGLLGENGIDGARAVADAVEARLVVRPIRRSASLT